MNRRTTDAETLAKTVGQKMLGHDYCDYAIDAFADAVHRGRSHIDLGEYLLEHYPGVMRHMAAHTVFRLALQRWQLCLWSSISRGMAPRITRLLPFAIVPPETLLSST